MFPTLFGPAADGRRRIAVRGGPGRRPRGRRSRRAGPQPGPRRDRRGADRAPAGPAGRAGRVRRERRILFDGVRAEIHPYDVTVERDGAAEAYDCKWGARGINADVLHQLDDARAHAADEDERLRVGARRVRRRAVVRGPPRAPDRAARRDHDRRPRDARRRRAAVSDDRARARTPARRRTGSASTRPGRTAGCGPPSCCAMPRTWPGTTRPGGASIGRGTRRAA